MKIEDEYRQKMSVFLVICVIALCVLNILIEADQSENSYQSIKLKFMGMEINYHKGPTETTSDDETVDEDAYIEGKTYVEGARTQDSGTITDELEELKAAELELKTFLDSKLREAEARLELKTLDELYFKLYSYHPGTNILKTVYRDKDFLVPHTNPIIPATDGTAEFYLNEECQIVLKRFDVTYLSIFLYPGKIKNDQTMTTSLPGSNINMMLYAGVDGKIKFKVYEE
jgi:hypothetical protein